MPRLTRVNKQPAPMDTSPRTEPVEHGDRFGELFTLRYDPLPRMARPRRLARLPHVVVLLLAVFFGLTTNHELTEYYRFTGGLPVLAAVLTGASIALALFRPIPAWWLGLFTAGLAAGVTYAHVRQNEPWPWLPSGYVAFALIILLVTLRVSPRTTVSVVALSTGLTGLTELFFAPVQGASTFVVCGVLFGVAGLLGYALRAMRSARRQLVVQENVAEEERARRTLLEERSRIARELHDVVAHHMSVISIQAQVAPHLVENPSEELRENLAGIRQNALEALTELRRVLGVLRSEHPEDPANPHHPQPTLAELEGLVDNVRGAGLEVTTETAGIRRPLTPGVELTAYRIVQEALSNCLRHAPGSRVEVGIAYGPRDLHLCVANSAPTRPASPSPGAGHGLLGMRERAGMLGGELAAGPRPDGGYEVSVVLPLDPAVGSSSETKKKDR
ncbi:histidine kinase [Streptomyces sp. NPDC057939]|uniref:histidine kinase n=1 Tax=Streptomyces sp. NPDC057939 TaxID=3346284 RepID=UPI0036EDA3BE